MPSIFIKRDAAHKTQASLLSCSNNNHHQALKGAKIQTTTHNYLSHVTVLFNSKLFKIKVALGMPFATWHLGLDC